MTPPASLRRASAADLAPLERLMADFAAETRWPPQRVHPAFRAFRADDPLLRVWLASRDGSPCAFAVSHRAFDLAAGPGCWLSDLYVDPAARRTGIARALVTAVADEALAHGELWMSWHADADNPSALAFYAALGAEAKPRHLVHTIGDLRAGLRRG